MENLTKTAHLDLETRSIKFIESILNISDPIKVTIEKSIVALYYTKNDPSKDKVIEYYEEDDHLIIIRKQNGKITLVEIIHPELIP